MLKNVWVEDAQIIVESKDLAKNQRSVLLMTSDVADFLSDEGTTSCVIVAPKGFGKTLVLKLKRMSLQRNAYNCLPLGSIVDRPKDRPPVLPMEIVDLLEQSATWETLWQLAFCLCFLRGYQSDVVVEQALSRLRQQCAGNPALTNMLVDHEIDTPFDILHSCLSASRGDLFDLMSRVQHFTRAFRMIHRQCAIFVDNIDEYLNDYLNLLLRKKGRIQSEYLRIWHNGQIGAWLALRRLQGINPHVKIFVSIRKEAYHFASTNEADFANLRAFRAELRYTRSDIAQIIENNIKAEKPENLCDRTSVDPIVQFVGPSNEFVSNSGTGKQEPLGDYWLRHCSLRPRDAVSIGREISKIAVRERSRSSIRDAINVAAGERVQNLFREVMPFFDALFPDLLPKVITSNVLSWDEINAAAAKYQELAASEYGIASEAAAHPFCALYSIGLIGVVHANRNNHNNLVQSFAAVGEVPFGSVGVLPRAERYVVHPSLSDYIGKKNVNFYRSLNKHNVIGHGLEWRLEEDIRFVLVGDIKGYRSSVMSGVGESQTFSKYWANLFKQFTLNIDYASSYQDYFWNHLKSCNQLK